MFTRQIQILLATAIFILLTGNITLFSKLGTIYPVATHGFSAHNLLSLISVAGFFIFATTLFIVWIGQGRIGKWIIATLLVLSAFAAYYMDQYGVIIDADMIHNIFETDAQEAAGLLSLEMIVRAVLLGIVPAILIVKFWPRTTDKKHELKSRVKLSGALIAGIILTIAIAPANFASFVREHKLARWYSNPMGYTNSIIVFATSALKNNHSNTKLVDTGADAIETGQEGKKELIILVVGETARADRFALNGYNRDTNPELMKRDVISFSNVTSCGTSTGESVPCMFSAFRRTEFNRENALNYKNALDVLSEKGVEVLWRDNNSDSKGVATRVKYENFKSPTLNPICDTECRDIGMLSGLDKYIADRKGKDILIVLHQMGNHGPEYYRRYPKEFEYFKPVCRTGELSECSQEEINNGYDNAIRYTDYFLAHVVDFLKKYENDHATAMFYVSDHGESLGEHGIYLHAAPYMIAPQEQKHVPAILWVGKNFDYSPTSFRQYMDYPLSHDDLFCGLMTAYEMHTSMCSNTDDVLTKNMHVYMAKQQQGSTG